MQLQAKYCLGLLISVGILTFSNQRSKLKIDDVQSVVAKSSDGDVRNKIDADQPGTDGDIETVVAKSSDGSIQTENVDIGQDYKHSDLLPRKIISVIGLESSGTRFVTSILANAHGLSKYREGSFPNHGYTRDGVLVQHFSLPWGSSCVGHPKQLIQNVVLPGHCSRPYNTLSDACKAMAKDANMTISETGYDIYPERYNLDIVASKEWYESKGVEQVFVIVLRDQTISAESRNEHCPNKILKEQEEAIGTEIIIRAINKYIKKGGRRLSASSYGSWYKETFGQQEKDIDEINNKIKDDGHRQLSSTLPSGNNVYLVSYETLLKLKEVYVEMIYEALGIESDYMPTFKDGNQKYVNIRGKPQQVQNHKSMRYKKPPS